VFGLGLALAAGMTAMAAPVASAHNHHSKPNDIWKTEFVEDALYSDGHLDKEVHIWPDADSVTTGAAIKQNLNLRGVLKDDCHKARDNAVAVGLNTAVGKEGEYALYFWKKTSKAIWRLSNDGTCETLKGSERTTVAGRKVPHHRHGGAVNPDAPEIFQSAGFDDYISDKYNTSSSERITVLKIETNSVKVQAVSSRLDPVGLSLTEYHLQYNKDKIEKWYMGGDLAFGNGELYMVAKGKCAKDVRYLIKINVPRLADGEVDPAGAWTYEIVKQLSAIKGAPSGNTKLYGLAYVGEHLYIGFHSKIFRADVESGEVTFYDTAKCVNDLSSGGGGLADPRYSTLELIPGDPDYYGKWNALKIYTNTGDYPEESTYHAQVTAKNEKGNLVRGAYVYFYLADADDVELTEDQPALSATSCRTGADGTCSVDITSTVRGDYKVHALIADPQTAGKPLVDVVDSPADFKFDPDVCEVDSMNVGTKIPGLYVPLEFKLALKDCHGGPAKGVTGERLDIVTGGGTYYVDGSFKELDDGYYSFEIANRTWDEISLTVQPPGLYEPCPLNTKEVCKN
jgi:hypothetical protein